MEYKYCIVGKFYSLLWFQIKIIRDVIFLYHYKKQNYCRGTVWKLTTIPIKTRIFIIHHSLKEILNQSKITLFLYLNNKFYFQQVEIPPFTNIKLCASS
jgi:hypothetical protein